MRVSERKLPSGVAVLQVGDWSVEDVNVFVESVERLVRDEPNVHHVVVRVVDDLPPALRYVVRVLDRQARTLGKTVQFGPPAAWIAETRSSVS